VTTWPKIDATIAQRLRLPEAGQIGYVVNDVDRTVAFCRDVLGIRPWMLLDERPEPCIERGQHVRPLLRIGLAYAGPVQIELIQVAEGETFHTGHLEKSEAEVHHLGFIVQDLDRRLKEYSKIGLAVLQRGTIKETGFVVDYAYLDTAGVAGIVLELIRWRIGPVPLPVNGTVFNLVARLGSMTLFRGRVLK
jgi:catechol 2,3-dioxygenase-like lactoylglutathione lyase family enzyme